jgi:hypothetical protein
MGRDYISELQPPTGLLFIAQIYEYEKAWYNDTDRGKPKISKVNLSQCRYVYHKSHIDCLGSEPVPPR